MSSRVHCYLRRERRKWALTQKELAFLLSKASSSHMSRLEQCARLPSTAILIASEVLFGLSPREIFPTLYGEIEEKVLARAATLYELLEREASMAATKKKEFLAALLDRAITRLNDLEGV